MMSDASASISIDPRSTSPGPGIVALQCLILCAIIGLVFKSPILNMVYRWRTDGNWSHGWLVPVFSIYFLAIHRNQLKASACQPSYLGALVIAAALSLYYGALAWGYDYPQALAIIPCMLGMVLLIWGGSIFRVAWFPICYLVFAMPLPRSIYFRITLPLREFASQVSGWVLGLLPKVYTSVQGVVIDYERGTAQRGSLNVEEACSGMRLMMAFCSLGVAMAYLGDRPLWQRVVMIACCVPIAVFCNMIRVLVTGVVHVYGREDLAQGTAHGLLGLAMLPIALGLFALVGYVLSNLVVDVEEESRAE
ncbi:MAG: hypothetical protein DHS20C16_17760 [Phycisphaerae bacterium]|nr:MAG: hypothetical protein DHS20C16_17760 [Phycisphaerae bacterium]